LGDTTEKLRQLNKRLLEQQQARRSQVEDQESKLISDQESILKEKDQMLNQLEVSLLFLCLSVCSFSSQLNSFLVFRFSG
jgi:hypothetical protein